MRKYGYVRVPAKDQNPERQITAMDQEGVREKPDTAKTGRRDRKCVEKGGALWKKENDASGRLCKPSYFLIRKSISCCHSFRKIAKRHKKRYDNIVARVRLKSEIQQRESGNDCP